MRRFKLEVLPGLFASITHEYLIYFLIGVWIVRVWLISKLCLQATMDIPGLNLSQQEYYPYVYYKIDCNLLEFK